jgi:hypothetical protein
MQAIFHRDEMIGEATATSAGTEPCEPIEIQRGHRVPAASLNKTDYVVKIAESDAVLAVARQLVHERYSARDYCVSNQSSDCRHETTVVVFDRQTISATATLRLDSPYGIGADAIFKDQVDLFRDEGAEVCEITRFAVCPRADSKLVLSAVYHFLYIVILSLRQPTHIFIEVNPRHRRFYEIVFGFECRSEVRMNPRVNAPAFLMQVKTDYLATRVYNTSDNLAFPRFYTAQEEHSIRTRFANIQPLPIPFRPPLEVLAQL